MDFVLTKREGGPKSQIFSKCHVWMAPINVTFTLQARETRGDDLGRRGPGVAHPAHRVHHRDRPRRALLVLRRLVRRHDHHGHPGHRGRQQWGE